MCIRDRVYTYCLTHKMLYWAANSGDNLYWMSSPYKDEYGSTFAFSNFEIERLDPHVTSAFGKDSIKSHHQQDYDAIRKHDLMTQDSICLLYTSDAADERSSVDLGGRRIIKKKK